jgi:hypothetical protein
MGRSPIQRILPNCIREFIVSEFNSDSKEAIGHNLETNSQPSKYYWLDVENALHCCGKDNTESN